MAHDSRSLCLTHCSHHGWERERGKSQVPITPPRACAKCPEDFFQEASNDQLLQIWLWILVDYCWGSRGVGVGMEGGWEAGKGVRTVTLTLFDGKIIDSNHNVFLSNILILLKYFYLNLKLLFYIPIWGPSPSCSPTSPTISPTHPSSTSQRGWILP